MLIVNFADVSHRFLLVPNPCARNGCRIPRKARPTDATHFDKEE
jgi:hypothetical protein